ncbi:TonB-dependent receptor plug domain-containing protein [Sinomicrobium soli]|uniref:TonB-dependent receptor plug domain-containing protein n=1 Tax=Sinomicrobium sp. N-1-3-6 TaxID=2219864 RepID=UPI000DCF151F|nr:TonB-dependent receptor [Sinomicrobium sp. N-1-3-6]RAV30623.1 TonB-dependent receptor [Sinomicrobium sp. N-1-3-6]
MSAKNNRCTAIWRYLWGCLPVFAAYAGYAQEKDSLTEYRQLEEVVLWQQRKLPEHTAPVPVQVLTGEALKKLNSLSVADAVRYFSGVQLKDYGGVGGLKTINVRSMGTEHTGVFYDGIRLGNAQNGQVDLGKYALDNMEEIALYNGQRPDAGQSAKAYASASTIYLQSRKPEFAAGETYHLHAGIKTGSFGLANPYLNLDYKISDYLSARLSTAYTYAHGRYKYRFTNGVYDTTATRENADINAWRVEGALYGTTGFNSKWFLKYYHYDSERGLPGAVVANRFYRAQRLWDRNSFLQGEFRQQVSERYSVVFRGKYSKDYSRYLDPEMVTTSGFLDNRYHQESLYFSLSNTYRFTGFWKLGLAVDYENNTLDANLYRFAYPERNNYLVALTTNIDLPRLNIQAGLLSTTVKDRVRYYKGAEDRQEFTPTLMAGWQPFGNPDFRLRAFYKRIFRMPTFNDLYYTFIGNTFLKPEYTRQLNAGFSYRYHPGTYLLELQGDVYRIWIRDKIVAVPGTNLFRWTMLNLGKVETTGIEAKAKLSGETGWGLVYGAQLSFTWQEALDVTPGSSAYGDQIPYIPVHSGSAGISAAYRKWQLNYSFIYTGERYSQKANIPSNYLQPWYTHDMAARHEMNVFGNKMEVAVEINNLLNQYYDVIRNFPMPGRSYRIVLNYTL